MKHKAFFLILIPVIFLSSCQEEGGKAPVSSGNETIKTSTYQTELDSLYGNYRWQYDKLPEEMSGKTILQAILYTKETFSLSSPYSGEQRAYLKIRTHPRYGKDILFGVRSGILMQKYVSARFDDRPMRKFDIIESENGDHTALFIANYNEFLKELKKSKSLRLEVKFYEEPTQILRFNVEGLKWP